MHTSHSKPDRNFWQIYKAAIAFIFVLSFGILLSAPAQAHHAMGGKLPANLFEGLLAGLAHPIIGLDHFAFVVAVGLLASVQGRGGLFIPIAFVLSAIAGTGIHLLSLDLPFPELVISASVFGFGVMLARQSHPNVMVTIALAAIAGIFHGYAYGESIIGAEMSPLAAYLAGFTVMQLGIAVTAFGIGKRVLPQESSPLYLRFAGFTIAGAGLAFLASAIGG